MEAMEAMAPPHARTKANRNGMRENDRGPDARMNSGAGYTRPPKANRTPDRRAGRS